MYVDGESQAFQDAMSNYPTLAQYTVPLKQMERKLVGRESEMRALLAAFARAELSNVILLAEAGSGKALSDETMIPVDDFRKFVRMGDIQEGDVVFDEYGEPTRVIGVYPQGDGELYRVGFASGAEVTCDGEHIWRVVSEAGVEDVTLNELMERGMFSFDERSLYSVPWCGAVERRADHDVVGVASWERGRSHSAMMQWGSGVEIPRPAYRMVLASTLERRKSYVNGFLSNFANTWQLESKFDIFDESSDGCIQVQVDADYVEDAQWVRRIMRSCGLGVSEVTPLGDGLIVWWCWRCDEALRLEGDDIVSVRPVGRGFATCIRVDSPTHTYLCTEDHVVTHNTALMQGAMVKDAKRIYLEVDLPRMIADVSNPDEVANKLKALFAEAGKYSRSEAHEVVLFIDEFHQVVAVSPIVVEVLKPLLADSATRGIRVAAATTFDEFRKYISPNQPLVERLQRLNVPEVDKATCVSILKEMAIRYGVSGAVPDDGLYELIYEYANRYIPANAQPRKSILLLDSMIGWYRAEGRKLDMSLLADVIYESEGVNVAFRVDPTTIKERLDEVVLAQDFATSVIAQRLQLCVADLNDSTRPMATMLFTGSTGTGKTALTKALANVLFGDASRSLIRQDMSEFANPDSLERFRIELTQRVWERPYSIVMLDEIEKACAEVTRLLLQVLDDARLSDANGRVVSFNNCYIVMTTNAGNEIYKTIAQYETSDTGSGEFLERYGKLIRRSLTKTTGDNKFPPELLGRIDCIVPFQPLSDATMADIVKGKLIELKRELWRKHGVRLQVSKRVIDYLVKDHLDTDSDSGGARAVMSKLEDEVTCAVAAYVNANPTVKHIGVKVGGTMAHDNKHLVYGDAYIRVVNTAIPDSEGQNAENTVEW